LPRHMYLHCCIRGRVPNGYRSEMLHCGAIVLIFMTRFFAFRELFVGIPGD
jgi:hypothetical protein